MKLAVAILALLVGILVAEVRRRGELLERGSVGTAPEVAESEAFAPQETPLPLLELADVPSDAPAQVRPDAVPQSPGPRQVTYFAGRSSGMQSVGGGGRAPLIPLTNLGEAEARKFRVTIVRTVDGGVVASGRFYDGDPGTIPNYRSPLEAGRSPAWKMTGEIVIRGLTDVVDSQQWEGMLVREGTATYHIPYHGDRTVAAYRLSSVPAPTPHPKAWMWKP